MPLYDLYCDNCGTLDDVLCSHEESTTCPECGDVAERLPSIQHAQGIIWSNQESSSMLGRTFETNQQKRDYLASNPRIVEFTKGDATDRRIGDKIKNREHTVARGHGHSSPQEWKQHMALMKEDPQSRPAAAKQKRKAFDLPG